MLAPRREEVVVKDGVSETPADQGGDVAEPAKMRFNLANYAVDLVAGSPRDVLKESHNSNSVAPAIVRVEIGGDDFRIRRTASDAKPDSLTAKLVGFAN